MALLIYARNNSVYFGDQIEDHSVHVHCPYPHPFSLAGIACLTLAVLLCVLLWSTAATASFKGPAKRTGELEDGDEDDDADDVNRD